MVVSPMIFLMEDLSFQTEGEGGFTYFLASDAEITSQ